MPARNASSKQSFESGTVFAVPLEGGGYGCAIIGKRWPITGRKHNNIYCYGFNERYLSVPLLSDVHAKTIYDVVTFVNCDDMSLCNGRWKILGSMPGYEPSKWPLPVTCNQDFIHIMHPEEFRSVAFENNGYLNQKDFKHIPPMNGLGDQIYLEFNLDASIEKAKSSDYVPRTEYSLKVWDECIKLAAADGMIPWLDKKGVLKTKPATEKVPLGSSGVNKKKGKVAKSPAIKLPGSPKDRFWSIIESAKKTAKGDLSEMAAKITKRLSNLTPQQIKDFKTQLYKTLHSAYTWDLWAASAIMCGGASDDGFEYWRAWLIAQGRETFEVALANPESLASRRLSFISDGTYEFEELLYVADNAYEEATEESLEVDLPDPPSKPKGKKWEEDDLPTRLPRLWKKFSQE